MTRNVWLATAMAGALIFASGAFAQSDDQSRIETVIVTGKRVPQDKVPMKVTFTQSTINPEQILNVSPGPTTTVQTLLNTEPSIYATTGGANGMETNIKFRSFYDGEFGETFAGVPLNDIFNSGVTYQADNRNNVLFTVKDLNSVDIYRGVNNPAVNTYNSLGGTINFNPRQPSETMGGNVGVDGGSFGTLDFFGQFDTGDWNGVKQTISVERQYSSGWLENAGDWNENLYYAGNAHFGNTEVFSYFLYNKNEGDAPQFIPITLMNQNWDYQWPESIYREHSFDSNFLGVIGIKSEIADFLTIEDEAYGGDNNYHRTSFSNPNYPGPYYIDDQGSYSAFWFWMGYNKAAINSLFPTPTPGQAYGLYSLTAGKSYAFFGTNYHFYGYNGALYGDRLQITADLPFNKITAGGDFNLGELHSREYWYGAYYMPIIEGYNDAWDEHDTRDMFSFYLQDEIHFWDDRIHITPGIKYIGSSAKDNDALGFYYFPPGSLHSDEHFLSPTVGASVEPIDNFTVYAAYGKNVKFPDITALYGELGYGGLVPPVTVQPEYAIDLEAGARYKWDSLQVEMNVYQERFTHIIYTAYPAALLGAGEQLNGGDERFRGVEFQLTDDFGEFYVGNWKGFLNASYNEAICTTPTSNTFTGGNCNVGQSVTNVPRYLLNAGLTWDHDGWHVTVEEHYVGQQQLQDYFTGLPVTAGEINAGQPTKIPDYALTNIGVVKVIPVENLGPVQAVRLALNVDNLFDEHYFTDAEVNTDNLPTGTGEDFYGLAGAGRAAYASVSVYF